MSHKLIALAMAAVIILAGTIIMVPNDDITWDALKDIDQTAYERTKALSSNKTVTIEDAAVFTLFKCGLTDTLIGKEQFDRRSMISYSGIIDNIDKDYSEQAQRTDLTLMLSNSVGLRNAYSSGTPYMSNGLALPIFGYTSGMMTEYTNANSSIIRYCVYVETDYDTDDDGKRDLVKVLLQIPRSAIEGKYKAPVILECNPYGVGVLMDEYAVIDAEDSYDLSKLYSQPDPRVPTGSIDTMSLVLSAKSTDWNSDSSYYYSIESYDYFLIRGYAVAICCGLGSYGSEGFACTGTDIELSSYRKVVEWFDGKATAFSDLNGCKTAASDWSNGNVGTYGPSYTGTIQIGLATMGIPNLKTIIPLGAICNWYDYAVCQGGYIQDPVPYIYYLTSFVSSRFIDSGFTPEYMNYLAKLKYDESLLKGNYTDGDSDFWSSRDYRNLELNPGTSVLLIEGLNDLNVKTKQLDLAYHMFSDAGYTVKSILHLGMHQDLYNWMIFDNPVGYLKGVLDIDSRSFLDVLNEWYSHYLFGAVNGATDMMNVCVQDNLDGGWSYYDDFDTSSSYFAESTSSEINTISFEEYDNDPVFKTVSDSGRSVITFDIDEDITIFGVPKVSVKASTSNAADNVLMTVALYDVCENGMTTYLNHVPSIDMNAVQPTGRKMWFGNSLTNFDIVNFYPSDCRYHLITSASIDMNNPSSNYESKTAVPEKIDADTYYCYNLYLNPSVYTIEKGHTLAVVIYTLDPNNINIQYQKLEYEDYSLTIDESSVNVMLTTL